ncbi:MAG TPA: MarR family transcriptional regulator [Solirubrobacteraceae bacterium]
MSQLLEANREPLEPHSEPQAAKADLPAHPLIGLLLRLVYQQYAQAIDAALREAGFDDIRPAAANVFPFVPPQGITVSELAELARVRKQTMAQAVDQLERTAYVARRPNPRDRRSRLVFLTERGASVPPVTHAAAERVEQHWAQATSPRELESLRASLLRLLTELRGEKP